MAETPEEFTITVRFEDALRNALTTAARQETIEVSPELISDIILDYRAVRRNHVEGNLVLHVTRDSWDEFTRKTGYGV